MLYYLAVGIVGAVVSVLIALVGRSQIPLLAAIIPLFPTFTILAYSLHYYNYQHQDLTRFALISIISALAIMSFNIAFMFIHEHLSFIPSIGTSLVIWFAAAYLIYYFLIKPL